MKAVEIYNALMQNEAALIMLTEEIGEDAVRRYIEYKGEDSDVSWHDIGKQAVSELLKRPLDRDG